MARPIRIILVSADWEEASQLARRACEEASKLTGLELVERKEDWDFLTEHGAKDEYGGVDIPQVFLEYEDGRVVHVMTRVPLSQDGSPDVDAAVRAIVERARGSS